MLNDDIENIVEDSFYLAYHAHIQPSEIDKLSTYEFKIYMRLLKESVEDDRDFKVELAKNSLGIGSILG